MLKLMTVLLVAGWLTLPAIAGYQVTESQFTRAKAGEANKSNYKQAEQSKFDSAAAEDKLLNWKDDDGKKAESPKPEGFTSEKSRRYLRYRCYDRISYAPAYDYVGYFTPEYSGNYYGGYYYSSYSSYERYSRYTHSNFGYYSSYESYERYVNRTVYYQFPGYSPAYYYPM